MFTADDARKNRIYPFMDKIFDSIKEVSKNGSSLYVLFDGESYPYLSQQEEKAIEQILTDCGYGFYWDSGPRGYTSISITWY